MTIVIHNIKINAILYCGLKKLFNQNLLKVFNHIAFMMLVKNLKLNISTYSIFNFVLIIYLL